MNKTCNQAAQLTAAAIVLLAVALLLLAPAAQHPGAGPVTQGLLWVSLLGLFADLKPRLR